MLRAIDLFLRQSIRARIAWRMDELGMTPKNLRYKMSLLYIDRETANKAMLRPERLRLSQMIVLARVLNVSVYSLIDPGLKQLEADQPPAPIKTVAVKRKPKGS